MKVNLRFNRFDLATDAGWVSENLGPALKRIYPDSDTRDIGVTRVFPRANGGFTLQYHLSRLDGGPFYLCGHLLGETESPPDYIESGNGTVVWNEDVGLAVPLFPFDPKLKSLPEFWIQDGARQLLDLLDWSQPGDQSPVSREILAYRLEKRCVFRLEEIPAPGDGRPGRRVVVKVVRPRKLAAILRAHFALIECGFDPEPGNDVTVARILHVDERRGTFIMESAPGASLHGLTETAPLARPYEGAARALNRLHSCRLPWLSRYTWCDEIGQLSGWLTRIGPMFPEVAGLFGASEHLVRDHSINAEVPEGEITCIHRDYYDKQCLFAPGGTTLLDYDNISLGDPAQDYGNFLAHVILRRLQFPESRDQLDLGREAFVRSFTRNDQDFVGRAAWWQAATLLRLAALYALRPKWRHLAVPLLEETNSCIRSHSAAG